MSHKGSKGGWREAVLPTQVVWAVVWGYIVDLFCFSQNENVNRAYTSTHRVADLRRPDRRTPMKVLVDKTYNFVDVLWEAYMEHNKTDLR